DPGTSAASRSHRRASSAEGRSGLTFGRRHDQPVELVGDLDLAGQTRVRAHVEAEIEHVFFHRRRADDLLEAGFVDLDMAGRAGTGAAAFGFDAGNAVTDG